MGYFIKEGRLERNRVMVNFRDFYKRYPLAFFGTLAAGHKQLGHRVLDFFWETRCLDCPYRLHLTCRNWDAGDFEIQQEQAAS